MPNCIHGIDDRFCATCSKKSGQRTGRKQTVQARAAAHNPATPVERAALEAVYAYEEARSRQKDRTVRASRTWQMIQRHGIIAAVERIVSRPDDAAGYRVLVEMGMEDMAFEHVVLRFPEAFTQEAIEASRARLERLQDGHGSES